MQYTPNESRLDVGDGFNVSMASVDTPNYKLYFEVVVLVILTLVSISGNFIVAFSLIKRQQLMTPSNRLVLSLTASNLFFSLFVLPFVLVSRIQEKWIFGIFLCNLNGFISLLISVASTVTLAMIAIDRYFAIVKPMLYALKMTNERAAMVLVFIWFLGLACSTPPLLGWSKYGYRPEAYTCFVRWQDEPYFSSVYLIIGFVFPVVTMITCYYLILLVARTKCRRISVGVLRQVFQETTPTLIATNFPHHQSSPVLSFRVQRKPSLNFQSDSIPIKGIWTICIIFGSFIISYSPFVLHICFVIFKSDVSLPSWIHFWSTILFFSSSASYSFIYGLYNRTIRKELKAFLFSKSSDIFQGLPSKQSMKRTSGNCSFADFNLFKMKSHQSAPHLGQLESVISKTDLPSLWQRKESFRKVSQDSGAVMTTGEASDTELESSLELNSFSHLFPQRRCSAPSTLLCDENSDRKFTPKPGIKDIAEVHFDSGPASKLNAPNLARYNSKSRTKSMFLDHLVDEPNSLRSSDEGLGNDSVIK